MRIAQGFRYRPHKRTVDPIAFQSHPHYRLRSLRIKLSAHQSTSANAVTTVNGGAVDTPLPYPYGLFPSVIASNFSGRELRMGIGWVHLRYLYPIILNPTLIPAQPSPAYQPTNPARSRCSKPSQVCVRVCACACIGLKTSVLFLATA